MNRAEEIRASWYTDKLAEMSKAVKSETSINILLSIQASLQMCADRLKERIRTDNDGTTTSDMLTDKQDGPYPYKEFEHSRRVTDKHEHASGVTRSHKAPGYHHIPYEALECAAQRFDSGLVNRRLQGKPSWQDNRENTLADPEFYVQALDHMQEHLSKLSNRDFSEDDEWGHIGAILWGASVWAWYVRNRKPSTGEGGT